MNATQIIEAIRETTTARIDILRALEDGNALKQLSVTDADQEAVEEAHDIISKENDQCGYMALDMGEWVPVMNHAEATAVIGRKPETHEYRPRPQPQVVRYVADGRTVYGVYDNGKSAAKYQEESAQAAMETANHFNLKMTTETN